jgi:hypothetical protein
MMNVEKLKEAIKIAGEKTIIGLLYHMQYSEREDISILLEREKKALTIKNVVNVLSKNDSLLWGVYIHAQEAEKQDLEKLANRVA